MLKPEKCCENCFFYQPDDDPYRNRETGACLRFPTPILKLPDDWCGEHKDIKRGAK